MCSDVVIRAEGLTKSYRVFNQSADRLKQAVTFGRRQYYKRFTALDNISFEIRKGETVGIIGRNGSGKSTLLQLVCGILKPSAGRVEVNGRISALLELGAGFHPDFTGRENVLFYATVLGMPREQIERRLPEIEAFADIGEFMDQPVRTYSSGMFVRLAFATAIHTDPDILVVDEALAVGDTAFQAKCYEKVQTLHDSGCTVVVVSHDLTRFERMFDRVALLERGRMVADGTPSTVLGIYLDLLRRNASEKLQAAPLPAGLAAPVRAKASTLRWQNAFRINPSAKRYGDGLAEIVEAGTFDLESHPSQTLARGTPFFIRFRVLHHATVERPIVSFSITDINGVALCGTTSAMQRIAIPTAPQGTVTEYTFRQILTLNPGSYLLNIGYSRWQHGAEAHCDLRVGYLSFEVTAAEKRAGYFDPASSIECEAASQ